MLDLCPPIKRTAVLLNNLVPAVGPPIFVVLTYAVLCGFFYFLGVTQVTPAIEFFRSWFGFQPVHVKASLPEGITNYQLAVLQSILSPISPKLEVRTAILWIGLFSLYSLRKITSRQARDMLREIYRRAFPVLQHSTVFTRQ